MRNIFKRFSFFIIILCIALVFLTASVKAFSFDVNPFSFIHKTTNIILQGTANIISYLIMQKRALFDDFSDPNIYAPPVVSSTTNQTSSSINTIPLKKNPTVKTPITISAPPALNNKVSTSTIANDKLEIVSLHNQIEELVTENDNYNSDSLILKYTNIERGSASLNSLQANKLLDHIASLRVDDLFTNQYFEHDSPDNKSVTDLAKSTGYAYLLIGENLALGNFEDDRGIVSAWMESPGHKANILNENYKELGISVKKGVYKGDETTIAVQVFGTPLAACAKPNQNTKNLIDTSSLSIKQKQAEAMVMYDNLNNLKNIPGIDGTYYNQKIQEYNYFAKKVNDAVLALKSLVDYYNLEVSKYNSCINL